jgi:hypothetical protein
VERGRKLDLLVGGVVEKMVLWVSEALGDREIGA